MKPLFCAGRQRGSASLRLLGALGLCLLSAPLLKGALLHLRFKPRTPEAPQSTRELLPGNLVGYAELDGLGERARGFLQSPLWRRIRSLPAYAEYEKSANYRELMQGVAFAQLAAGKPLDQALGVLLGRRISVGLAPRESSPEPGFLVVVETGEEADAQEVIAALQRVEQWNADAKLRRATVRGIEVFIPDSKLQFCRVERFLVAANDPDLLRSIIDRAFGEGDSFAASALCRACDAGRPQGAPVSAALDSAFLHTASGKPRWLEQRLDETGASLLFHDLLEAAARSPFLTAYLTENASGLSIRLPLPIAPAQLPEEFRCFLHAKARNESIGLLGGDPTFAALCTWRNADWFWKDHRKLLAESTELGFAEFDSGLAVFFGGRVLSEELLPFLGEDHLFLGTCQTYPGEKHPPKTRFPAGAWVFRMKEPERWGEELASAFHTLIGVINADRGQKRQTPLLMFTDRYHDVTVYGARFLSEDDRPADLGRYNFSPAMARVGDRVVIATATETLYQVIDALEAGSIEALPRGTLTHLRLYGAATQRLLADNHEPLIAQAMLEKGKTLEQATLELDLFTSIAGMIERVDLSSTCEDAGFEVRLDVLLKPMPQDSAVGASGAAASAEIPR